MPMTGRCKALNCHAMVIRPDRYCDNHQAMEQQAQQKRKEYDQIRYQTYNYKCNNMNRMESEQNKFYHTKQWRSIRETVLRRDNYLCQYCLKHGRVRKGNIGDHIIPYEVELENRTSFYLTLRLVALNATVSKQNRNSFTMGRELEILIKNNIPIRGVENLPDCQKNSR